MNGQKRNGSIDFWKFIVAFIVVLFHSKNFTRSDSMFIGGKLGVEFFFIISGFLMAKKAYQPPLNDLSLGKDTVAFIKKKIFSLIPEVYLAWVIGFIVENIFRSPSLKATAVNLGGSIWDLLFIYKSGLSGFQANRVTWYLSAMLLAMAILYPLMMKFKDTYFYILAPLVSIFLYGQLYQNSFGKTSSFIFGVFSTGLVRGFAGICLGCVCFSVCKKLAEISFTKLARVLLTIIQIGSYAAPIVWCYGNAYSQAYYPMILSFAVGITISFSRQGMFSDFFDKELFYWLGAYSFPLYLSNIYWSHVIKAMFRPLSDFNRLLMYLLICNITALFVMYFSKFLRWMWRIYSSKIKRCIISEKPA